MLSCSRDQPNTCSGCFYLLQLLSFSYRHTSLAGSTLPVTAESAALSGNWQRNNNMIIVTKGTIWLEAGARHTGLHCKSRWNKKTGWIMNLSSQASKDRRRQPTTRWQIDLRFGKKMGDRFQEGSSICCKSSHQVHHLYLSRTSISVGSFNFILITEKDWRQD